jgi:antitoxin YefM
METISYTNIRQNLAKTMNRVCDEHDFVIVTRQSAKPVIMMSLEDFNSLQETMYLLKSSKNANKLFESLGQLAKGNYQSRELLE